MKRLLRIFGKQKRSPRILLVNPPYQRLRGMISSELPLGLLYLAATMRKSGFETVVLNLEEEGPGEGLKLGYANAFETYDFYVKNKSSYNHPAWKEYIDFLGSYRPDVVGFSVMTPYVSLSLDMARIAKEQLGAFVVFGGPHPTLCPDDMASRAPVDAVVVGEGEMAFLQLIQGLEQGSADFLGKVPSVVFRGENGIVTTPQQPLIPDLDSLPYPDYSALVRPTTAALSHRFGVAVSRGCPYRCTFCVNHLIWRERTRFRSDSAVVEEIRHLYNNLGLKTLFIQQDSFLNKPSLARAITAAIKESGMDFQWWCLARSEQIKGDIVAEMKATGLNSIVLGIESGSQRILDMMRKKITIPEIERSVAILKEHGIRTCAFFMVGIPDETEEDIQQTIDLMKRLPLDFVSISVFTPLPGSILFNRTVELGMMDRNPDWDRFDYQSPENYFCPNIKRERFSELLTDLSHLADEINSRA